MRYSYTSSGHLLASMEMLDLPVSLIFTAQFGGSDISMEGVHTLEALWWRDTPEVGGFVALANVTDAPIQVSIQPGGSQGTKIAPTGVAVGPHSTQMFDLDSLARDLPEAENQWGGLRLQYSGRMNGIIATGGLWDEATGYSADIPFWVHDGDPSSPSSVITYASVGLMMGKPDPMMGFPAGLSFTPYVVIENTTPQPLSVTWAFNYMSHGAPISLSLPVQQLSPFETRRLGLASMLANLGLENFNGDGNARFSFTGHAGDLVLATGSVDQTRNYVFAVVPQGVAKSMGKATNYWSLANGLDSMYSIWNPTDAAQDVVVTLHYGDGSRAYEMPIHLDPQATAMIDVATLKSQRWPDAHGKVMPDGVMEGSVVFSNPKGKTEWMTLAISGGFYNPLKGTCGVNCINCYGYSNPQVALNPFYVAVQHNTTENAQATYTDGTLQNMGTSGWTSTNTSIATVSSSGVVTGMAPGSFEVYAQYYSFVACTCQMCSGGVPECPTEAPSEGSPGSALSANMTVNFATKDSGDSLTFPAGTYHCGQNLGLQSCANGWFWQSEIKGTVSDDASKWTASQTVTGGSWSYCLTTGNCYNPGVTLGNDSILAVQNSSGTTNVYWLDAPGIRNTTQNLNTATYTLNLQSKITEGAVSACVNWHIKVVLTAGAVLDTTNSTSGIDNYTCQ